MEIRWLTGFIDLPIDTFETAASFWQQVTESRLSPPRGADGEFATLIPLTGDAYMRVQRTPHGPRIHLDLHVDSVFEARREAEQLGATVEADLGHQVMKSPTGFTFCLVSHRGESRRPEPAHQAGDHRLDQVCIDVPSSLFEQETEFWRALTGWELHHSQLPEFAFLSQPPTLPLRLLFQRLGVEDDREFTSAHLDIACGQQVEEVKELHMRTGAEFVGRGMRWTTMRDPAGVPYCLTQRDVTTGRITS